MRLLAAVPARAAAFQETRTLAALTAPVVSHGRLSYRRPDHLEKQTEAPVRETLVVDGDLLTLSQDGQPARTIDLDAQPALGALVTAIAGTLAGDGRRLTASYSVTLQGDAASWRMLLVPLDRQVAGLVRSITLSGAGDAVRGVDTVQANGDTDVMTIEPAP